MRRVGVGIEEGIATASTPSRCSLSASGAQRRDVERRDDLAIAPIRSCTPKRSARGISGSSRGSAGRTDRTIAARDLEHVAEARGGHERSLGAFALDQRLIPASCHD